jgi:hypothetical protein
MKETTMNQTLNPNLANAHTTIFKALQPFSSDERFRIVESVLALLGEPAKMMASPIETATRQAATGKTPTVAKQTEPGSAKAFFDAKRPANKVEEYAVAAAFIKKTTGKTTFPKEALAQVVSEAERHFNRDKLKRDLANARAAGLLSRDSKKDTITLLPQGQRYVDLLPDRHAALTLFPARKTSPTKQTVKKSKSGRSNGAKRKVSVAKTPRPQKPNRPVSRETPRAEQKHQTAA